MAIISHCKTCKQSKVKAGLVAGYCDNCTVDGLLADLAAQTSINESLELVNETLNRQLEEANEKLRQAEWSLSNRQNYIHIANKKLEDANEKLDEAKERVETLEARIMNGLEALQTGSPEKVKAALLPIPTSDDAVPPTQDKLT
jgi:predicted nuclease with TOPRIM domain